jgi:hypothetical protein
MSIAVPEPFEPVVLAFVVSPVDCKDAAAKEPAYVAPRFATLGDIVLNEPVPSPY